jgi:hypothetical protein
MTVERATNLSQLDTVYWRLLELRPTFPGAPLIRIRSDWREQTPPAGPAAALFRRHLSGARTILDVGGPGTGTGSPFWEPVLAALAPSARYRSTDIDKLHSHDYDDFMAVDDRFDAILMLELLEHLPLEMGLRFIEHAVGLLNRGGVLVIGTPTPPMPTTCGVSTSPTCAHGRRMTSGRSAGSAGLGKRRCTVR